MNGDISTVVGQAPMVQPQSGTVDHPPNSSSSGGDSPMDSDWRAQLTLEVRQGIVDKLLETLEKHLPSVQEGNQGLKKIAGRYEEKIFSAATTTSQSDYQRKISLTMLALERNSQVPLANSLQTGAADASKISSDLASNSMQSQSHNLGLSMPIVGGESQASQNMQNNVSAVGVQNSSSLASALPAVSNLTQVSLANTVCQDSSLQNNSSVGESQASQNMQNNVSAVGVQNSSSLESTLPAVSNLTQGSLANTVCQDSSLQNNSSAAEKSVMKQKLQPGDIKRNQNLIQTGQIQSSQHTIMQPTMMQAASLSGLEQNHQSSGQQSFQQMPDKLPQPVLGHHQQQPMQKLHVPHQQQTSMAQQPTMQTAQQTQPQPLTGQVSSDSRDSGIQQNQLLNNIQDLRQGLGLMSQQNNNANLQQQQLISQLNNIPNTHQLQLGGGVSGVQQSTIPGMQSISSSEMPNLQQNVPVQQQVNRNIYSLQNQTQQPQLSKPQTVSHVQSQLVPLPHVQLQSNSMQCNMRQKLPISGAMLQQQNLDSQEKQFCQSQQAIQKASSNPLHFTTQTESSGAGDWQEEAYQKIKSMKDAYLVELNAMYLKITTRLQTQHEGLPQQSTSEQISKIKFFKVMLERLVQFLQMSKNEVQIDHKDKLSSIEKQIISILNTGRAGKPTSLQPGQLPQPCLQNSQLQSQISQIQTQPLDPQTSAATMTQNTSSALLQNMSSSVPIIRSLTNSVQQPSSSFGSEQNSSPISLQLPQLGVQNSQPQSQISQMPTQSLNPHTSAATMAHNNFSAAHQNTLSSVQSDSNSMTNPVQQPSFRFGLGQNSKMLSPQLPKTGVQNSQPQSQISQKQAQPLKLQQTGIQNTQPQSQISQKQAQPLKLQQTSAATTTQNSFSALNQNMLSSVPSMSYSLMSSGQQPSFSVGLGHNNSSLISPQQVAVNSLQQNIALSGPQSSNPVGPFISSQAGLNGLLPNFNSLSLQNPYPNPLLQQQLHMHQQQLKLQLYTQQQQLMQQQLMQRQLMDLQPSAQLQGHPSPQINQQNVVTALTKTETPLHSTNPSVVVTTSSNPVSASPKHGKSKKVNASPSTLSKNTTPLQAAKAAGSSTLTQAPGHPSLHINQHNSATSLTKTGKPLHSADSLDIVPPASTPVAPSPVHAESEKVNASPNSAGSSIANTNTGHLEAPNAAGSSVLPLSIFVGDSKIVSASLSSQPNTHILHLEAPNPSDSSAKPLAISVTISIA